MRYSSEAPPAARRAIILADYDNLYQALTRRLDRSSDPETYVIDALNELQRYLLDGDGTQTVLVRAYADFATLEREASSHIQRSLYQRGIEPRYAPTAAQDHASEMQMAVDAVDLLHRRSDVHTVVLVTGDRACLPLVQMLRSYGRRALVAAMDVPSSTDGDDNALEDEVYLDLLNLLDEPARRSLADRSHEARSSSSSTPTVGEPETFDELSDAILYRTLEIAEEHFGQYDEVYLTPLLRKLSELLGSQYDPKTLISDLEDSGAVRLEKRDGYPYDYTVLIVHDNHPDVQTVRQAVRRSVDVEHAFEDDDFYDASFDDEDDYGPSSYLDDYARLDGDGRDEDDYEQDEYEEDGYDQGEYDEDGHDEEDASERARDDEMNEQEMSKEER